MLLLVYLQSLSPSRECSNLLVPQQRGGSDKRQLAAAMDAVGLFITLESRHGGRLIPARATLKQ